MRINEIKEQVKNGILKLSKHDAGMKSKVRYIWDKDYNHIIEVKKYHFQSYTYRAEYEDGAGYSISKKDYLELSK